MLWFLVIHILALLIWAGALLYLPALIALSGGHRDQTFELPGDIISLPRFVFTRIATPFGLFAIIAGTWVFIMNGTTDVWLIAKLTVVTLLVMSHAAVGLLIIRLESGSDKPLRPWCLLVGLTVVLLESLIVWLVLAKPGLQVPF